jgi:hypothetical protein
MSGQAFGGLFQAVSSLLKKDNSSYADVKCAPASRGVSCVSTMPMPEPSALVLAGFGSIFFQPLQNVSETFVAPIVASITRTTTPAKNKKNPSMKS